jgi:hypothetical protein
MKGQEASLYRLTMVPPPACQINPAGHHTRTKTAAQGSAGASRGGGGGGGGRKGRLGRDFDKTCSVICARDGLEQ